MSSSSFVFRMVQPYFHCLERYPIRTKSLTASFVLGAGDALSQYLERRNRRITMQSTGEEVQLSHDFVRTAKMSSYGLILLGPVLHNWYKALNMLTRNSKSVNVTSAHKTGFMNKPIVVKIKNGLKQTIIDQTTAGPFCVAMFMVYMTAVDGKDVVEKLDRDYLTAMKIYYKIWPIIQFVNFTFVPLHFRVLVVNTVSVCWNAVLSHLQYGKDMPIKQPAAIESVANVATSSAIQS